MTKDTQKIAAILVSGDPMDYALRDDGNLVVIAPTGQKFVFTPAQVDAALAKSQPKPPNTTQAPKQAQKPAAKPSPKPAAAKKPPYKSPKN